jgi:hypothetical protein
MPRMSRRSTASPPRPASNPVTASRPWNPIRDARVWVVAAVLVAAAGLAWWRLAPRPTAPPAAADPAAALDARTAFEIAGRLGSAGRNIESLPYFRRAAEGAPKLWETQFNYVAALANAALEVRTRLGRTDPALRSSYDRIASVRLALSLEARAIATSRTPRTRAYTAYENAMLYLNWGFPLDALAGARRARAFDSSWAAPAELVDQIDRDMSHGGRP